MKKTLGILLALCMLAAFAACGSDGYSQSNMGYSTPASGAENYSDIEGGYSANANFDFAEALTGSYDDDTWRYEDFTSTEEYDYTPEAPFKSVEASPLSTFSSDVDTASYSNMRRQIGYGMQPQGVRIEELVNYFSYDYPAPSPEDEHPFSITTEVSVCPWNENHLLAMIGIQGAKLESTEDIANNIVFLIDVSGSMSSEDKLPLLKESFKLLIDELGENDVISIVTYAGNERVLADSISGSDHKQLKKIIDSLSTGGSTAGAKGIQTAYELAEKNYIPEGNNRIILATDGDFNVGVSSTEELIKLIEEKREGGVYISVLGFGMGNLKDNRMEAIADHGNGNYAYIDTLQEAQKVLVDEFDSTMFTIANDLKLQVEFNASTVSQYRLIGYNNRRMEDEDFNDDTKDAGDIGSGHSVTAFYELIPFGGDDASSVDDLIYQTRQTTESDDFMTVKVRYKQPGENESRLVQQAVTAVQYTQSPGENFLFASAVAEFGLLLTDSDYMSGASAAAAEARARQSLGNDPYGLRAEFASLVGAYQQLD